jgi:hypothetical protein
MMVTALLAATGLMFCQGLSTFDGGVAKIEEGPQYIMGDSTFCTPRTVLSPDGSKPFDLTPLTQQSVARPPIDTRVPESGIVETTLIPPKPIAGPNGGACKTTYQVKTLELEFPKGKVELTKELRVQLAIVMADSPVGLSLVGYVEDKAPSRNTEETARLRMQAIRSQVERLAVSMPSMTLEERPLAAKRLGQREGDLILLTAVLANPCGERVLPPRAAPTMSRANDGKGGTVQ